MVDQSALAAELSPRHGVTTRARLRRRGITDRQIDRLVGNGRLLKAGNGVLVDASAENTFLQRVAIACAVTRGVASFRTALEIWQYRGRGNDPRIHVTVSWGRRVTAPQGVVVHRCRRLDERDIVRRPDGIAVWSPPRALVDAGAVVMAAALESMVEQGLDERRFVLTTLAAVCTRNAHPARPGSCALARVLASRPLWLQPVRSDYELRLEKALRAVGFPRLVREHPVVLLDGSIVHPDLGVPEDGFFVEIDHELWHQGSRHAYDKVRDLEIRLTGRAVERVARRRGVRGAEAFGPEPPPAGRSGSAGRPAAMLRRRPSGRRCFELERQPPVAARITPASRRRS